MTSVRIVDIGKLHSHKNRKGIAMRMVKIILGPFLLIISLGLTRPEYKATATIKVLRFGKLVDSAGKIITNAVIVIENDRIRSVSADGSTIPAGAEVIDL